ncbi:hypothetical protein M8A51_23065 [Schlegelella sp. S2-27]|uniref:Uncharacterized protein n=1 Tax=Caldimonas mangrovi TaxID=2944811 RepID=A0ABT0YUJ4_9BURK|nr:hypothetical protein [Caldimonas mangrovi]MCM5682419.1 hypothetical protein [Caldimonas mangrovi]
MNAPAPSLADDFPDTLPPGQVDVDLGAPAAPQPTTWLGRLRETVRRFSEGDYAHAQLRCSLLPYLITCSPVLATSVLAPPWLSWLMSGPSVLALYRVTQVLDETAFQVPPHRGALAYAIPLNGVLLLWCLLLALAGHGPLIPMGALPMTALLCLAVAPACRRQRDRTHRRVPLQWSFGVAGVLVVALHGVAAFMTDLNAQGDMVWR